MELQQEPTINNTPAVVEFNFDEIKKALGAALIKYDDNAPAVVEFNFEEAKKALDARLEKYNSLVITQETLKDGKKIPTEINKIKKHIDELRKNKVTELSVHIKQFDQDMKSLAEKCEVLRQPLLDQIKVFEDKTRETVEGLLTECRAWLFEQHGVTEEFYKAEFDDLIKVSALTAGGKLTKSAKDTLQNRVLADKAVQDRVERRLLQLENQSLKAGLTAPLNRHHVEHFLLWEDDDYQREVTRIIGVEVERQKQTEKALLVKKQREGDLQKQVEQEAPAATVEPEPEPEPAATIRQQVQEAPARTRGVSRPSSPTGKKSFDVTCVFNVTVPAGVKERAIDTEIRKVLQRAGISTLSAVYVKPARVDAVAY